MRRRRCKRPQAFTGNPFVVFADMTIALAFIFAVHGLASVASSSQALVAIKRKARQISLRDELSSVMTNYFPGSSARLVQPAGLTDTYLSVVEKSNSEIAAIWINGNFVRVSVYRPIFNSSGTEFIGKGRSLYLSMGKVMKVHARAFAYLYVHGIVERDEGLSKRASLELSRRRADRVMAMLQSDRVVGKTSSPDEQMDEFGVPMVRAKYAIAYGTGTELYTSGQPVGRADIVLCYEDIVSDGR